MWYLEALGTSRYDNTRREKTRQDKYKTGQDRKLQDAKRETACIIMPKEVLDNKTDRLQLAESLYI